MNPCHLGTQPLSWRARRALNANKQCQHPSPRYLVLYPRPSRPFFPFFPPLTSGPTLDSTLNPMPCVRLSTSPPAVALSFLKEAPRPRHKSLRLPPRTLRQTRAKGLDSLDSLIHAQQSNKLGDRALPWARTVLNELSSRFASVTTSTYRHAAPSVISRWWTKKSAQYCGATSMRLAGGGCFVSPKEVGF